MSVRPIAFAADGGVTVFHDDLGHGGDVAVASIRFNGGNPDFLELPCPVCGAVSVHPIGGGCAPGFVQKMFLRIWIRRAVSLGIPVGERTFAGIKARVKARVQGMDGAARWRLEQMTGEDDNPGMG